MSSSGEERKTGLKVGDCDYRAWVGPPGEYDVIAAIQVTLLLCAGLRETHRLVDVGCGSLRAGRMLIPYLKPGHYFGVEPNEWLVREGIERELGNDIVKVKCPTFRFVEDFSVGAFGIDFDFAIAQSVFSHTYPDLASHGLKEIAGALAPGGLFFATFKEGDSGNDGSGWLYPGTVPYTWEEMRKLVEDSGMVARRLDWRHPRQSWFVATSSSSEAELTELTKNLQYPLYTVR